MLTLLAPAKLVCAVLLGDAAILLAATGYILRVNFRGTWRSLGQTIEMAMQRRAYARTYEESLLRLQEATCQPANNNRPWPAGCQFAGGGPTCPVGPVRLVSRSVAGGGKGDCPGTSCVSEGRGATLP
jgi:hypothetical protein